MYLNDTQRSGFYEAIGLDAREYDKEVIEKTNDTAGRIFPIILDVKNPKFYAYLEKCVSNVEKIQEVQSGKGPKALKILKNVPSFVNTGVQFIKLYLMKPIPTAQLEGTIR